ncbi:MAG TPA: aminotransferase class IV [Vicinamibacterales bacterium]|nr:aminotransferase class IV [Vicinamibacterales bacterium]
MSVFVNVNGQIADGAHAAISVFDHGFLYGEGVYETVRTYNAEPFLFDRHMTRLRASAAMIMLDVPLSDEQYLQRSLETMKAAGLGRNSDGSIQEAYVRILHTRGIGDLTYDPAATPQPSVVVIVKSLPVTPDEHYQHGVKVCMVDIIRNHPKSVNPLIKSNNLLNNALCMQQAMRKGGIEGVFRNYRGELSECSQSNLFIVKNGVVRTPPLDAGLLAGITRAFVFEIGAEAGVKVEEAMLHDDDLFRADEAFFTSSTKELMPIVEVDDRTIGRGKPGAVTQTLLETFRRRANELTTGRVAAR